MHLRQHSLLLKNIAFAIVMFGVLLRGKQYIANRSLWLDEANLVLNIVNRSLSALIQPLDYDQGAPIGFLVIQKIIIQILGNKDYFLRLLPFVAGIVAMFLMYKVAERYMKGAGIPIAVGFFAVSGQLIYYASEAKQYSSDVLIVLLLLFTAYPCLKSNATVKNFFILNCVGMVSMWMSHPALFINIGIGLTLTLDVLMRKDRRKLSWFIGMVLLWLINFSALYLISLRSLAANRSLIDYWRYSFMPMPPWHNPIWFKEAFFAMLQNPVGLTTVSIGTVIFFAGCISLLLRRWQFALILLLPFPMLLLASGFEKYPFGNRLLLFLVPLVFLLIAEGIERIHVILLKYNSVIAFGALALLTILLLYHPVKSSLYTFRHPRMGEHIKPVMSYMRQNRKSTDSIYIYYGAVPAFRYYASAYGFEDGDYTVGVSSRNEPKEYIQDIYKHKGHKRAWFLFSHNCWRCIVNEEQFFLTILDRIGNKTNESKSVEASVYLYDLRTTR